MRWSNGHFHPPFSRHLWQEAANVDLDGGRDTLVVFLFSAKFIIVNGLSLLQAGLYPRAENPLYNVDNTANKFSVQVHYICSRNLF